MCVHFLTTNLVLLKQETDYHLLTNSLLSQNLLKCSLIQFSIFFVCIRNSITDYKLIKTERHF